MLAQEAPELGEALERARDEGLPHVILDGKIIEADRCREKTISVKGEADNLWYSGKAHCHGGNVQAVFTPGGFPLWVSDAEPGSVHDITAARRNAPPGLYRAAAAGLSAPRRSRLRRRRHRCAHPGQAARRRPGTRYRYPHPQRHPALAALPRERGFALLTTRWRALQHITASPSKIGSIARAALVLTHFEYRYIT